MATVVRTQKRPNIGASLAVGLEKKYQSEKEERQKVESEKREQEGLLEREDYKIWAQAYLAKKTSLDFKSWTEQGKPLIRTPGEELETRVNQAMIDYISARDSGKDTIEPLKRVRTLKRLQKGELTIEEEASRIKDEREWKDQQQAKEIAASAANLQTKIEAQKNILSSEQAFQRVETTRKLVWQEHLTELSSKLSVAEGKELTKVKKEMLIELEDMKSEREKEIAETIAGGKAAEGDAKRLADAEMELNKSMFRIVEKDITGGKTVQSALQGHIDRVNRLRRKMGIPEVTFESGVKSWWPDAQWGIIDPAGIIIGNEPAEQPAGVIKGPPPGTKGSGITPIDLPGA